MSRQEHFLGSPKNIVGSSQADLVLETLGKVYIKSGKNTKTLNEIIKSMMVSSTTNNIIIRDSIEDIEYPGDGWFVFEGSTKSLYFTYKGEFCSIIEGASDDYVKKTGDIMTGALTIKTSDAPLKITSQDLIENLNAEYLSGVKGEKFTQYDEKEEISGDWEFLNYIKFWNGVLFGKDTYYDGSLMSYQGFASGYNGYGWMIDAETNTLTIDNLVVRKVLSVYELVVNKISATNGSLWVSDAAKIEEAIDLTLMLYNQQTKTPTVTIPYCGSQTYSDAFTTYTRYGESNLYSNDFVYNDLMIIGVRPETGLTLDNINTYDSEEKKWLYWNYFTGKFFKIILNQESSFYPPFRPNDILRCQKYEKGSIKYYDAIVTNTSTEFIIIRLGGNIFDRYTTISVDEDGNITRTDSMNSGSNPTEQLGEEQILAIPQKGDSLVRIGNTNADSNRQGSIYITSSDDEAPYISIMDEVNRPDFSVLQRELIHLNKCGPNNESVIRARTRRPEKVRLGKLDGLFDPRFGIDQPKGYGLYGENVYLSGRIIALNTDDSEGELIGEYKGIWYQYNLYDQTTSELSNLDNYCRYGIDSGRTIGTNHYYYANEITYNGSLWRCIRGHDTYVDDNNKRTIYLPENYLVIDDITQTCAPQPKVYDTIITSPWQLKVQKGDSGSGYTLDLSNEFAVFGGDARDISPYEASVKNVVGTTDAHFYYDIDELPSTWKIDPLDATIDWVTKMNWIIHKWDGTQWVEWVDSTNWTTRKFDDDGNISTDPNAKFYYEVVLTAGIRVEVLGFLQIKDKVEIKITAAYIDPDTFQQVSREKNFNITRVTDNPAYDFSFVPSNLIYHSDGNWDINTITFVVSKNYNLNWTPLTYNGNGEWEDTVNSKKFKIRWKNWSKTEQTLPWSFLNSNTITTGQSPYIDIDTTTKKPKYPYMYFQLYDGEQINPAPDQYIASAIEDLPIGFSHEAATEISVFYSWDNLNPNTMGSGSPISGNFNTMTQAQRDAVLTTIWQRIRTVTKRSTLQSAYGWSINPPAKHVNGIILEIKGYSFDLDETLQVVETENPSIKCYWTKPKDISGEKGDAGILKQIVHLYKRNQTEPTNDITTNATYTFSTGTFNASQYGTWFVDSSVLLGTDQLWAISAIATETTSGSDTAVILPSDWKAITRDGINGLNSAVVSLYCRYTATTQNPKPDKPTSNVTYRFSDGKIITGTYFPWTQSIPASNGESCWIIQAPAVSSNTTDVIVPDDWSEPVEFLKDGLDSDREVKIYKLTANDASTGELVAPTWDPCSVQGTQNYPLCNPTITNGEFIAPSGWTKSYIPEQEGSTVWWSMATITSIGTGIPHFVVYKNAQDCDYIWSPPYQVSAKGEPGKDGETGPSINFQGEWQAGGKYYFNANHRIVVFKQSGNIRTYYQLKLMGEILGTYIQLPSQCTISYPDSCCLTSSAPTVNVNCDQYGHYTTIDPSATNGDKVWNKMNLSFFNNVATQLLITDDILTHNISVNATIYIGWDSVSDGWALYGTGFKSKSYIPNEPVTLKDSKYVDLHGVEYTESTQPQLDGYFKYYNVSSVTQTKVWDWITAQAVNTTTSNWKFRPYAKDYANGYYDTPEIGFNPAEPFAARGIKLNFNPDERYYGNEVGKIPIANWKIIDSPAFVLTPTNAYFKGTLWSNGIEVTVQEVIEGTGIFKIHTEPGSADYWKTDIALNKIYNTIPAMPKNSIAYPTVVVSDITATKWIIPEYYTESGNYYTKPWNIDNSTVANIPVKIKIHPTQHCLFITANDFNQNPYNPPTFNYSDIVTEIFQTNWATYSTTIMPKILTSIFGNYSLETSKKYWAVENGVMSWQAIPTSGGSSLEASITAASSACNCGTLCSHLFKITIGTNSRDCVVTKPYIDSLNHVVGIANTIDSTTYQIKNIKVVSSESAITDTPDTLFLILDTSP